MFEYHKLNKVQVLNSIATIISSIFGQSECNKVKLQRYLIVIKIVYKTSHLLKQI